MALRLFITLCLLCAPLHFAWAQTAPVLNDTAPSLSVETETPLVTSTDDTTTPVEALTKKAAGLPQFDPKWWPNQIFWIGLTFMAMYIFFGKLALPRIEKVVSSREEHIKSYLDKAETLSHQAEDIKSAYESMLTKALQDADDAATRVAEESKSRLSHALQLFHNHHDKEIAETDQRLQKIHDDIMKEMDGIVAKAASSIAQKIAGVTPDNDQVERVVKSLNDKAKAA